VHRFVRAQRIGRWRRRGVAGVGVQFRH
jgi:hypothetical protein